MTRWRTAMAVLSTALAAACTPVHEYRRVVMGAECRILVAADEATADRAAEAAFRRATELSPTLDRAWYGLGLSLIAQSRLEEALSPLRRSTELQPMSPHAWYQLARVHAQRGETEQARAIIEHLRRFEPRVAAQLTGETGLVPVQA